MATKTQLETKAGEITDRRNRIAALFAKKSADGSLDWTKDDRETYTQLDKEVAELTPKYLEEKALFDKEEANRLALEEMNAPIHPSGHRRGTVGGIDHKHILARDAHGHDGAALGRSDFGSLFVESKSFKTHHEAGGGNFRGGFSDSNFELKALMTRADGWDPFSGRLPGAVLSPQQQPSIINLFPTGQTSQAAIKYMLETTYTSGAAEKAEGAAYGESALELTEQLEAIQKIAAFLPVTDEQLADVEEARSYINGRLDLQIRQRFDSQLINGNGTSPNLRGLVNTVGIISHNKAVGDNVPDALFRAMTKIQTQNFTQASGIIMNPVDWELVRLLKTTEGLYIYGAPMDSGPQRIWGLPVLTTTYMTATNAIVADFSQTQVWYRKGIEFKVSDSHSDYFIKGQLCIRAEMRAALVVYRPKGIALVDLDPA